MIVAVPGAALILAWARTWGLLRILPAWRMIVGGSWELVSAVLAGLVASAAVLIAPAPLAPMQLEDLLLAAALEFALGSSIGVVVGLPGWALLGAGEASASGLGLNAADLRSGPRTPTLALVGLSAAAMLKLGLYAPALTGLLDTFDRFPLARPEVWLVAEEGLVRASIEGTAHASVLALALATPVLLIRLIVDLGLQVLAGGPEPSARVLACLGPGLRAGLAVLALAASWSAYTEVWAGALAN